MKKHVLQGISAGMLVGVWGYCCSPGGDRLTAFRGERERTKLAQQVTLATTVELSISSSMSNKLRARICKIQSDASDISLLQSSSQSSFATLTAHRHPSQPRCIEPSAAPPLLALQPVPAGMESSRPVPGNCSQAWPRGAQTSRPRRDRSAGSWGREGRPDGCALMFPTSFSLFHLKH